jgi:hypothetical protein
MVMVFYVLFCVLCVVVCARGSWFSWVSAVGSYLKYNISCYGILLGVGISIVELDTYAILVKYLTQENGGREKKMTNQLCVLLCVVKNCYLLIMIFPTANMRRTYEGIGIYADD